jgi:hypothetical protein
VQSIRATDIPNHYGREPLMQSVINRYTSLVRSDRIVRTIHGIYQRCGVANNALARRGIVAGI